MVFFASARCNLEHAQAALARSLTVQRTGPSSLDVAWPNTNGPTLRVSLVAGPHVRAEGHQIAAQTPHAPAMAACDARFEIHIDDLAGALDEMNTLMEIQMTLQDLTTGLMFNTWTGKLTAAS